MTEYRLTETGRIGLRMLLDAESLYRADRNGLHLLGMEDVVDLPDEWVEPAPPPLPPEPPNGTALRVRYRDGWTAILERDDNAPRNQLERRWYSTGISNNPSRWEDVASGVESMTRLVPAPEPVTPDRLRNGDRVLIEAEIVCADTRPRVRTINAGPGYHRGAYRSTNAVSYLDLPEVHWWPKPYWLSAADQAEAVDRG